MGVVCCKNSVEIEESDGSSVESISQDVEKEKEEEKEEEEETTENVEMEDFHDWLLKFANTNGVNTEGTSLTLEERVRSVKDLITSQFPDNFEVVTEKRRSQFTKLVNKSYYEIHKTNRLNEESTEKYVRDHIPMFFFAQKGKRRIVGGVILELNANGSVKICALASRPTGKGHGKYAVENMVRLLNVASEKCLVWGVWGISLEPHLSYLYEKYGNMKELPGVKVYYDYSKDYVPVMFRLK